MMRLCDLSSHAGRSQWFVRLNRYSSDDDDVLFWHLADEVLLRFEFQ